MRSALSRFSSWLIAALLLAAAGGIGSYFFTAGHRKMPRIDFETVHRGDLIQRVTASGTVNPVKIVSVGTQISGTVQKLLVDFNQPVKAGQILAELDPALINAQLDETRASLASAKVQAEIVNRGFTRATSLSRQGFISAAAIDNTKRDVEAAAARIATLNAELARDETNLRYTVIRSPIDGIVVDRQVDIGQTVAANFQTPTLFKIAQDLRHMQIDTSVPEADIAKLKPGLAVSFTVDAHPSMMFVGTIREVRLNPTSIQNVVTYDVVVDTSNESGALLPGMTAEVSTIVASEKNVLRVPNAALLYHPPPGAPIIESKANDETVTTRKLSAWKLVGSDGLQQIFFDPGLSGNGFIGVPESAFSDGDRVAVKRKSAPSR